MRLVHRIVLPCLIGGALGLTMLGCSGHSTAPPTITSSSSPFSPAQAPIGSTLYIFGSGFNGATGVTIGGVSAPFIVYADSQINAQVPGNVQTGFVVVTTPAGTSTSSTPFYVTPTITGISNVTYPALGSTMNPGDSVTIAGSGFIGATAPLVFYGPTTIAGNPASPVRTPQAVYTVLNANEITTTVPTGIPAGSGYVLTVTVPGPNGGSINNNSPDNILPNPSFTIQ